ARAGASRQPAAQRSDMQQHTSTTTIHRAEGGPRVEETGSRDSAHARLWAMTPSQRIDAMWKSQLTLQELAHWSSHAPHEVPLLGGEFAWIAMRTPDWAEAGPKDARAA
ncbi:MAG: hypothetical protein ACXVHL_23095, partial [Solirubrobacteraceae bacterium]